MKGYETVLYDKFKLVMAVSADGYVARGPRDDMRWTGFTDKQVFKLLTLSHPVLLVGRKTFDMMPCLPGRTVLAISRDPDRGLTLERAALECPGAWLGGGAEVARAALDAGLVGVSYVCRTSALLGGGVPFSPIRDRLPKNPMQTLVMDPTCTVEVFLHGP